MTPAASTSVNPRMTLGVIGGIVVALLVAVGVRAGVVAALVVGVIAVAMLALPAVVLTVVERRRAAAAAQTAQAATAAGRPVKHCDCCDRACLTAAICEPGPEPLVTHE